MGALLLAFDETRVMAMPTGSGPVDDGAGRVVPDRGIAYWLSGALAATAAASALLTYLPAGVLRGTAVMNGSARGTALAVAVVGVPVLACSVILAWRGSVIAVVTWLGAVWFLLYNSLMFVFATPANQLFLLYLAMLSLALWSAGTLLWRLDLGALARLIPARAGTYGQRQALGQTPPAVRKEVPDCPNGRWFHLGSISMIAPMAVRLPFPLGVRGGDRGGHSACLHHP